MCGGRRLLLDLVLVGGRELEDLGLHVGGHLLLDLILVGREVDRDHGGR